MPHLTLKGVVVERREHPVRGIGTVLVGRVHRRGPRRRIERIGRGERLVEGHRMDVEAGVEARGVAERLEVGPRARDDVTSQPYDGSSSASARATCDEPPRGKNWSALRRRRDETPAQCGGPATGAPRTRTLSTRRREMTDED